MKKSTQNMKFYYKKQTIFGMNLQLELKAEEDKKYNNNNNKKYHKWLVKEKFKIITNLNCLILGFKAI